MSLQDSRIPGRTSGGPFSVTGIRVISVATPGRRRREQDIAKELQADHVSLSTRGKLVIVDRRDSLLLFQAPRAAIDSIHEVPDEIRHLQH